MILQLSPPPSTSILPPVASPTRLLPIPGLRFREKIQPLKPSPTRLPSPGLRFREKVLYLQDSLGMDPTSALSLNPSLRSVPLSSVLSVADFLSTYGIPTPDSGRIFRMYPHLLTCDPHADLAPVLRFLLGPAQIPFPDLRKSILRCPRLLVCGVRDQLLPALLFLRRIGFRRISPQTALLLVSSIDRTLLPKLDYIQNLGFTYGETVSMVLRSPALLTFSVESNFKPKVGFLVGEMGMGVRELKGFPHYFSFSLERKIRPRHQMLLENGAGSLTLAEMLTPSDGEFRERLLGMKLGLLGEDL